MKILNRPGNFALILVLFFCALGSPAARAAEDSVKVSLKTSALPKTQSLDSELPITFILSGGFATKTMDCRDITGLRLDIYISDDAGTEAYYGDAERSYEGLWSGWGWKTKVIPTGLECTWTYDGTSFVSLNKAYFKDGNWLFAQSWRDGPAKDGFFKAKKFKISWSSPKVNYNWSSGRPQEILGQEGSWVIPVGGSLAPEVTFTGLDRGTLIRMPISVDVMAIGSSARAISEFNFGPADSNLLWVKETNSGSSSEWTQKSAGNCTTPVATVKSPEQTIYTAICTFIPRDNFQNKPFRATAYTTDHHAFFSAEVYVNTEITKGNSIPTGSIELVNDSKGVPVRASVLGKFKDIPIGTQVEVCLKGRNPSDPSNESSNCVPGVVKSDLTFTGEIALPKSYFLEASVTLPKGQNLGFGPELALSATFATEENLVYECQNFQSGCLSNPQTTPVTKSKSTGVKKTSDNKSKYSEGYRLINAAPSSLRSAGFYSYFSANKKMTKANAIRFCQNYLRIAYLRTDYFDGWGTNALSTFVQGCAAAAVKIPFGK